MKEESSKHSFLRAWFPLRYKFSDKTHPLQGIMSFILGMISAGALFFSVFLSFKAGGVTAGRYALAVLLGTIMAICGLVLGIVARMKVNCYHLFPDAGIAVNVITLLATWIMITEGYIAG